MHVSVKAAPAPAPGSAAPVMNAPLIDNPFAPEILASGCAGFANMNGVIVLTLENARCDHSQPNPAVERVVVGRVAMSVPTAQNLVASLNMFLEQQGMSPSKALAGDASFQ